MQTSEKTTLSDLQAIARTYRADWKILGPGGAVVIFEGEAQGWIAELNCPQGWQPGCMAITPENDLYQAQGGNEHDGAEVWEPLQISSTESKKTTLTDLLASTNTQVQALLADSVDEPIDFGDQPTTLTPPRIGDYWIGQGGYYAGIMRDGNRQWHLILADQQHGQILCEWGNYREIIPGEFSRRDGQHNTALILAGDQENKIASHFTALFIDGHKDFYWPAQCENILLFMNIPERSERKVHWSSTPYSQEYAWGLYAHDTHQIASCIDNHYAARAVRRVLI